MFIVFVFVLYISIDCQSPLVFMKTIEHDSAGIGVCLRLYLYAAGFDSFGGENPKLFYLHLWAGSSE